MSWITRHFLADLRECGCVGSCDCADQTDPHVQGAWQDIDEATTPTSRLRVAHGRTLAMGRDTGSPAPVSRPAPSLDELAARRATRPLSNAIGDVTPIAGPVDPLEAA